jgi:DNA-binding NarL/FixJ family response regulator
MRESVSKRCVGLFSREPLRVAGMAAVFQDHTTIAVVADDLESLLADEKLEYLIFDLIDNPAWMDMQFMVRRIRPDVRQIVLGPAGNEELILRSIGAGARAYLDSSAGPLVVRQAVETVMQGSIWAPRRVLSRLIDRLLSHAGSHGVLAAPVFSPRERQVLDLILSARSNREIATELGIEERTVKAYVASLLRKTGADNRIALSVQATQDSLREQKMLDS